MASILQFVLPEEKGKKMKAGSTNKGNRKSKRFFTGAVAVAMTWVVLACGEGCSSRRAITAPYDMESTIEYGGTYETAFENTEVNEEEGSLSGTFNRVGAEMFKVSDLLFSVVDSLNEAGN